MAFELRTQLNLQDIAKVKTDFKKIVTELQTYSDRNPISIRMGGLNNSVNQMNGLRDSMNGVSTATQSMSHNTTQSLGSMILRIAKMTLIYNGLFEALNQVKDGINTINEIDTKMTNISMINGMPKEQVASFTKDLSEQARDLKDTTVNLLSGAEAFMRAGRSVAETKILVADSTIMSKISGDNQKTISEQMLAIQNSYQFSSEQMQREFVDKISALDSASATSSSDIAQSVLKTAQSAKLAGVSWDFLLASMTSVMDVTKKSGSEVGNSIKNIFSRMQNIAKGVNSEDDVTLNQVEKALNKQGIALRTSLKEWRNMEDVIKDVQAKWSQMSSVDQSEIVSKMGGAYNRESLLVMFENQKKTAELMEVVNNSAGSSQEKYNEYLKSTAGQIAELKVSMEQFWMSAVNSSTINSAIQGITKLIDTLKYLTNEGSSSALQFLALGGTMIILVRNFASINTAVSTTIAFFKLLPIAMAEANGVATLMAMSFPRLVSAFNALKLAMIGLVTTPVGWAILAIGATLGVLTYAISQNIKKSEEHQATIKKTKEAYDNLSASIKDNSVTQDSADMKTLQDAQDKLQKAIKEKTDAQKILDEANGVTAPTVGSSQDSSVASINSYGVAIDSATKKSKEANTAFEEAVRILKDTGVEYDKTTGEIYALADAKAVLTAKSDVSKIVEETKYQFDHKVGLTELKKEYQSYVNTLSGAFGEYNKLISIENLSAQQKIRLSEVSNILQNSVGGLTVTTDENGKSIISNINLVADQIGYYNQEGFTLNGVQNMRISEAQVQNTAEMSKTNSTYSQTLQRINYYRSEIEALNRLRQASSNDSGDSVMGRANADLNYGLSQAEGERNNIIKQYGKIYDTSMPSLGSPYSTSSKGGGGSYIPSGKSGGSGGKNTSSKDQDIQNLDLKIDKYYEFKNAIEDVTNTLDRNKKAQDSATKSEDKIRLMNEEIALLQQKNSLTQQLQAKEQQEADTMKSRLASKGFTFDASGNITNYQTKLQALQDWANSLTGDAKKNAQDTVKNIEELVNNYTELIHNTIEKTKDDILSIQAEIKKAYEDQLNVVKNVQEKIMEVIRKRYDEEKDLIQKQQDAYNKSNETDDYNKNLTEEQKKLADIQAKIDIVKRDPNAKAKLQDLLKEAEEQQKAIDDMVLEHQRDLNNDIFDEKKKEIDDKSTNEKLVQLASDAISKGFINLGGKIIDIKSAYIDFENRFGDGLKATGQLIKSEFIEKLEQAQALIKQLQNINIHINATGADSPSVPSYAVGTTNVPSDTLAMIHAGKSIIPSSTNPFNGSNFINMIRQQVGYAIGSIRVPNISSNSTNGMNFNMNQPFLVIQGNVAKDSIGDLEKMVDKKMKDFKTLMKDALQSQGIY